MTPRQTLLALSLAIAAGVAHAQTRPAPTAPAAPAAPAADGVISNPDFEKAGQTAAHAWLLLLDRRDWGTAWDASAGGFRQSVPLGLWMDNVPKLREPFGAFVERQPAESLYKKSLPGRPDGDYVTSHFVSKFDRKAEVIETVTTMREPDGRWRVTGYTAR
ncbi:MAG TPA: DUF4019 domain-containing protein [Ramlibacter sp.]|jgi:hypothetical protein|nr:DUF4019 domain-containing protein [Ramlibacter sp.]